MPITREWAEENGRNGACEVCGRKTWIENGCAALCGGCEYDDDPDQNRGPQTLADVGMCEADFR